MTVGVVVAEGVHGRQRHGCGGMATGSGRRQKQRVDGGIRAWRYTSQICALVRSVALAK